jgi:hypothetical protein
VPAPEFPRGCRDLSAAGPAGRADRRRIQVRQDLDAMVVGGYCEPRNIIIILNPAGSQGREDQGVTKMIYTPRIEELLASGDSPDCHIDITAQATEGCPVTTP